MLAAPGAAPLHRARPPHTEPCPSCGTPVTPDRETRTDAHTIVADYWCPQCRTDWASGWWAA